MKKLYLVVIITFTLSATTNAQVITDGLVGYWPLNGDATDESIGENNGIVLGATKTNDRFGNENSAYSFDGIDDYIELGDVLDMGLNSYSISIWCRLENQGTYQGLFQKSTAGSANRWGLFIHNADNKYRVLVDGNQQLSIFSDDSFSGEWQHIVAIMDRNGAMQIYVNNILQSLTASLINESSVDLQSTISLRIGAYDSNGNSTWYAKGEIDDVMLFDRALIEQEIELLYTGESTATVAQTCENIFCDGENIGIGTQDTKGYRLAVAGGIMAEKVKVALQGNWPDIVFDENYTLRTLEETEQYINENNHLPEIPGETEVLQDGINLGEMNAKLLQKIEELTLYMIDINKQMKSHTGEIEQLKAKNIELKKDLSTLKNE